MNQLFRVNTQGIINLYAQDPDVSNNSVKILWMSYRRGKNSEGYLCNFEKNPILNGWDKFAEKWEIKKMETVSMEEFEKWNPQKIKVPESAFKPDTTPGLYKHWAYIAIRNRMAKSDRIKIDGEIYGEIYTQDQTEEMTEARYKIAQEILTSPIKKSFKKNDYLGPNISEIRNQCEALVDEGLRIMLKNTTHLEPEKRAMCLIEWEHILIQKMIKRCEKDQWEEICETLQLQRSIRQFFDLIEINSSWKELSKPMQAMFENALKKSRIS